MNRFLISILLFVSVIANGQWSTSPDTSSIVFVAILKPGLDNVKATINDSTVFITRQGQLILYWNNPQLAFIADGRNGCIPPELLIKVDTPYFKFNFSRGQFSYPSDNELNKAFKEAGTDLNALAKQIQDGNRNALLQFFMFRNDFDGAAREEFPLEFWALINFWTDKELSSFILTLDKSDKKEFCELLIESCYCNPYPYYRLYYPLTFKQLELIK
jgi:hypothetical protein